MKWTMAAFLSFFLILSPLRIPAQEAAPTSGDRPDRCSSSNRLAGIVTTPALDGIASPPARSPKGLLDRGDPINAIRCGIAGFFLGVPLMSLSFQMWYHHGGTIGLISPRVSAAWVGASIAVPFVLAALGAVTGWNRRTEPRTPGSKRATRVPVGRGIRSTIERMRSTMEAVPR